MTEPAWPSAPYNRRTIEDALFSWFAAGTALGVDRVWWADQGVPKTTFPFGVMSWNTTIPLGVDSIGVETIIEDVDFNPGDLDLNVIVGGWREVTISVQVFGDPKAPPESSASMRLEVALSRLRLPSVRTPLNDAGIGVLRVGGVRNVADGQAQADIVVLIAQNLIEPVVSIAGVKISPTDAELGDDIIAPEGFTPPE